MANFAKLPLIDPLRFDGNMYHNWKKWKRDYEDYLEASESDNKSNKVKIGILRHLIGQEGKDVLDTFVYAPPENAKKLDKVMEKLDNYFNMRKTTLYDRMKVYMMEPNNGEAIDHFVTRLKIAVNKADFGDQKDKIIRDRVVFVQTEQSLKDRLMEKGDIDLERALEIIRGYETRKMKDELVSDKKSNIDAVKTSERASRSNTGTRSMVIDCKKCNQNHERRRCPAFGETCRKCGKKNHFAARCRSSYEARQEKSDRQYVPKQHKMKYKHRKKRVDNVRDSSSDSSSSSDDNVVIGYISTADVHSVSSSWYETVSCNNVSFKCKLDTGAGVNILPNKIFKQLEDVRLKSTKISLTAYGGQKLLPLGKTRLRCAVRGTNTHIEFVVVDTDSPAILGLETCQKLGLVKRSRVEINTVNRNACENKNAEKSKMEHRPKETDDVKPKVKGNVTNSCNRADGKSKVKSNKNTQGNKTGDNKPEVKSSKTTQCNKTRLMGNVDFSEVKKEYSDVFEGIGCFPGEYHLEVDPSVRPVVHPVRTVPLSLHNKLEETLVGMVTDGIITKVDYPTDWVSSLLIVEKSNGELRVCIDPRDLNKALKREHYKMHTPDEILAKLGDMKVFTVLDLKWGFWNIKLDSESSDLTTFNTPFGRYKFNRLPFGISVAPEIFQKMNDSLFGNLPGVGISTDDFIIGGKNVDEHNKNLVRVLDKAREVNSKFNDAKVQYCQDSVKYLGKIITSVGTQVDPNKVQAISELASPQNKLDLKRILGMVNYLLPHIPHLAQITLPLRELNKKDAEWCWNDSYEQKFVELKEAICNSVNLNHFKQGVPIVIQCDASQGGLGGSLLQDGKPVMFTSRALTNAECNYAQIEKDVTGNCKCV